ncbi:5-formyltetrahydrofolate cyclo-ligase-like isoform 3-T3 [Morphnus guianensis]
MEPPGEGGDMAAALRGAKRALREELRQRLRALGAAEKQRQSRLLSRKVISHPKYQESKRIAIFLSMPDEIQTEEIIKDIFKQGKECFIPRYKPHCNHMDMLKLSSAEDISSLTLTSWNILQPSDDDSAREEALAGGACLFPKFTPTQLTFPFNRTMLLRAGYQLLSLLPCADSTGWSHRSTSEGSI